MVAKLSKFVLSAAISILAFSQNAMACEGKVNGDLVGPPDAEKVTINYLQPGYFSIENCAPIHGGTVKQRWFRPGQSGSAGEGATLPITPGSEHYPTPGPYSASAYVYEVNTTNCLEEQGGCFRATISAIFNYSRKPSTPIIEFDLSCPREGGVPIKTVRITNQDPDPPGEANNEPAIALLSLLENPVAKNMPKKLNGPLPYEGRYNVTVGKTYRAQAQLFNSEAYSEVTEITIPKCPNAPPGFNLGPDITVSEPLVTLMGQFSDPDGDGLKFSNWELVRKPIGSSATVSFQSLNATNFIYTDLPGEYEIRSSGNDGEISSAPDSILITKTSQPPIVELDIAQVVYNPEINGDEIIDLVNEKSGAVVFRLKNPDTNIPIPNVSFPSLLIKHEEALAQIPMTTTNQKGEIYGYFSPFSGSLQNNSFIKAEWTSPFDGQAKSIQKEVTMRSVPPISIGFVGFRGCKAGCWPFFGTLLADHVAKSADFFNAVYPIRDNGLRVIVDNDPLIWGSAIPTSSGIEKDIIQVRSLRKKLGDSPGNSGIPPDFLVAVLPESRLGFPSYLSYRGHPNAVGIAKFGDTVAFVQERYWTTASHEIAHNLCIRYDGIRGCSGINPHAHYPSNSNIINGFNSILSEFRSPIGPLTEKVSFLAANAALPESLYEKWADQGAYEKIFYRLVFGNASSLVESSEYIELGGVISNGVMHFEYAFEGKRPRLLGTGDSESITAKTFGIDGSEISETTAFDISQMVIEGGADLTPEKERFVIHVPYGYSTLGIDVHKQARFSNSENKKIFPVVELLRQKVSQIPDEAFRGDPVAIRGEIAYSLREVEQSLNSFDVFKAADRIEILANYVAEQFKLDFVPSDISEVSLAEYRDASRSSLVRLNLLGAKSDNPSNGLVVVFAPGSTIQLGSVLEIPGRIVAGVLDEGSEVVVEATLNGTNVELESNSDESFRFEKTIASAGTNSIGFKTYTRKKKAADSLKLAILDLSREIGVLEASLAVTKDPEKRAKLEAKIQKLVNQRNELSSQLDKLRVPHGNAIEFSILAQ